MEELKRALSGFLLKHLECPVCMENMVPPITLCTNGHNICSKCRESVQCCPTCRAEFSQIRCLALENIASCQKYPCENRDNGCFEWFYNERIAEHQAVCVFGKIKWPFKLNKNCPWEGFKSDLKQQQHMQQTSSEDHHSGILGLRIGLWKFHSALASYSCCTHVFEMAYFIVLFSWLAQAVRLLNTNVNLYYLQQMVLNGWVKHYLLEAI